MKALTDVLTAIQQGDQSMYAYLFESYRSLVTSMARSFATSCTTVDPEDLIQEASLALSDAAKTYKIGNTEVTFGLYAKICIRNRLISVQRKNRVKQKKVKKEKVESSVKKITLPV